MKAGIKIGLRDYKRRIPETQASICEVYFRIDHKDKYKQLFSMCSTKGIESGLHFWGLITGGYLYNLAYPDEKIQQESLSLIKETIDIASENKCRYVNVHPGNYMLAKIDLDKSRYSGFEKEVSKTEGNNVLFENINILSQYAKKRNVLFLVETVPQRDSLNWYEEQSRLNPVDIKYVSVETVIQIARQGYFITNDFGHTACAVISNDRSYIYQQLYKNSKILASQTKLIHPNTTRPPFNGIDTHNGLLDHDFSQNVIPDKQQLIELLKIFKNREDVWLIPEPIQNHEQNYLILQKMIDQITNYSLKN